jgi:hypothetical protein
LCENLSALSLGGVVSDDIVVAIYMCSLSARRARERFVIVVIHRKKRVTSKSKQLKATDTWNWMKRREKYLEGVVRWRSKAQFNV